MKTVLKRRLITLRTQMNNPWFMSGRPIVYHCTWEWKLSAFIRILILPRVMIGYVIFLLALGRSNGEREKIYFKQKLLPFAFYSLKKWASENVISRGIPCWEKEQTEDPVPVREGTYLPGRDSIEFYQLIKTTLGAYCWTVQCQGRWWTDDGRVHTLTV